MMRTTFALLAAVILATSSAFAGGACCAGMSADGKMDCSKTYAHMNLTADQKSQLDAAQAVCQKEGCTKESWNKFLHSAKRILSAKQYAELKSQCARMQPSEKTKS